MMQKETGFTPAPITKKRLSFNEQLARGLTLTEILIVIIIIGIVASLGVVNFSNIKERTLDKEAKQNLKLVIGAEKIYKMDISSYYNSGIAQPAAITNINTNLRLLLPAGSDRNWDYLTTVGGGSDCCAQATRNGGDSRTFRIRINTAEEQNPLAGGACP